MTHSLKKIIHTPRRFSQDEWGGTEAVVTNLALAQLEMGFSPEIHTSLALSNRKIDSFKNIPIYRYPYCYPFFNLSRDQITLLDKKGGNLLSWSLYRALRKMKDVRIYHAHVTKRMGGSVLKAAQLAKRPSVATLHGNIFDVPQSEAKDIVAAQTGHFEWGKPWGAYFKSRTMLDEVDAVICVGFSEFERAKEQLGSDRVHFLPNGVHAHRFKNTHDDALNARSKLGIPPNAFVFGCISRIDPQKNQELLIQAFAQIAHSQPEVHLIICGPVTIDSYLEKLKNQIQQSGFSNRIHLLPPVTPESEEQRGLFAALDTFVLASRHEPFGIVILEAWAAEKPVIASRIGGLAKLITHEKTGLHFESGDKHALSAAMNRFLTDENLRRATVENAQHEITHKYTWPQIAQQLELIYQQIEDKYVK